MKKGLIVVASALIMLSGCANNNGGNNDNPQQVTKYTVEFYVDGSKVSSNEVEDNSTIVFPTEPSKEGYNFTGWYTSENCLDSEKVSASTKVTGNLKLYAGFEEIPPEIYTITIDPKGGDYSGLTTIQVTEGNKLTEPVSPEKEGYNFEHWSATDGGASFDFTGNITSSFTLYAVYSEITIEGKYSISASSEESKFHCAEAAADENEDTFWKAAKKDEVQSLTIDLGSVKTVSHVKQEFAEIATWNFVIKGSHDGNIWVDILSGNQSGQVFEADCEGYFRYVKLEVAAGDNFASSKIFKADFKELSEGTNVVKNYKGLADCWAGGYETEKMFDGNLDTMFIPNSDHAGHYCGMEALDGINYYVKKVVFHMADEVNYFFKVDYEGADGAWHDAADYTSNDKASNTWEIEINDLANAILYHQTGINTNWHGIREMEVIGFKALSNCSHSTENSKEVYSLSSMSYVDRIKINDKTHGDRKIEISNDGVNFEEVSMDNVDGEYVLIEKDAKFVRYSDDRDGEYGDAIDIYGTSFKKNLAQGLAPVVDAAHVNSNASYASTMATINPDDKNGDACMYCNPDYEGQVEMTVDLGKVAYVDNIKLRVQDEQASNTLCFKVEDLTNNNVLLDTFDAPLSGRYIDINFSEGAYIENIKITFKILGTWTNLNSLQIYGFGC